VERRAAPGGRGQGRGADQGRNQTLATITLQNFFKLYDKLRHDRHRDDRGGEFWKIYKLDVIAIPTNRPMQRIEHPDVIYRTEREKFIAIADEIERITSGTSRSRGGDRVVGKIIAKEDDDVAHLQGRNSQNEHCPSSKIKSHPSGRPADSGRHRLDRKSERLSSAARTARHQARGAQRQAAQARGGDRGPGRPVGAVTIATNMAGRGTDIILGGNPETMAWAQLQDKYPTRLDVPRTNGTRWSKRSTSAKR
jgi:preprotein translocase subunit SecA